MATTPNMSVPYVVPADTVTSYPVTSAALANGLDVGTFGTAARFANAAARTAAVTAPLAGMLSYLQDTGGYERWNGTAWKPLASGAPGYRLVDLGPVVMLMGQASIATNSSGACVFTFPVTLPRAVITVNTGLGQNNFAGMILPRPATYSPTGFTLELFTHAGTLALSQAFEMSYLAVC